MSERLTETCSTCRFWNRDREEASGDGEYECRRYPPLRAPDFSGTAYWHFPETYPNDWCGEWAAGRRALQGDG